MKQYSPQGFLNFQDLLDKTHINTKILFTTIIKIDNEQGIFQMIVPCLNQEDIATVMDEKLNSRVDVDIVEINLNESQFWIKEQDSLNRLAHIDLDDNELLDSLLKENLLFHSYIDSYRKYYNPFSESTEPPYNNECKISPESFYKFYRKGLIHAQQIFKEIRDLLSSGKIASSVYYENKLHSIPNEVWIDDNNWYELLVYQGMVRVDNKSIEGIKPKPNREGNYGRVHFGEENFILHFNIETSRDTPQKAFHQWTMWLKVMSHFSLKYGDKLNSEKKIVLENDMKEYIKEKGLDISNTDIEYMAKMIRPPELREGKKRRQVKNKA